MHLDIILQPSNIYPVKKMLNKNVADYTNFDGKTNKKIVQAPGGASSFSIGWSNEKTDYGPERAQKKKSNYPQEPAYHNNQDYQKQGAFNYNEPIRVMEEKPQGFQRQDTYSIQQPNKNYGGQYGYNNIPQDYGKQKQQAIYQQDSLDLKLKEHGETKNSFSKPPQPPNHRACVKIHEQKSNILLGDNSYNYWKEQPEGRKNSHQSNRMNITEPPRSADKKQNYQQQQSQSYQYQQYQQPQQQQAHTSVKVHNPPGGKSSFTLG